jgi:hypothetical protein
MDYLDEAALQVKKLFRYIGKLDAYARNVLLLGCLILLVGVGQGKLLVMGMGFAFVCYGVYLDSMKGVERPEPGENKGFSFNFGNSDGGNDGGLRVVLPEEEGVRLGLPPDLMD